MLLGNDSISEIALSRRSFARKVLLIENSLSGQRLNRLSVSEKISFSCRKDCASY